jgi:hypothetical protein
VKTKKTITLSRSDSDETLLCPDLADVKKSSSTFSEGPVPLRELFVSRILIPIANYCILAFIGIAYSALLPLFYSTPMKYGGLGLSPPIIGYCIGGFGLINGLFQIFFFTRFVSLWGPKRIFLFGMSGYLPMYAMFPIIHVLASRWGLSPLIWTLMVFQLLCGVVVDMAYGEKFPSQSCVYY